jgi:ankyrin repeat protein
MSEAFLGAIESGDVDRVAKLLAAGADANATVISRYYTREFRLTPLLAAVRSLQTPGEPEPGCTIDTIVLLLRYGADVNRWDEDHSTTPLLIAALDNQIEAVRLLLAAGADPNVRGDEGESPLRFCAEKGHLEMARLLLLCGATKTIHEGGPPAGMNALGLAATRLHVDMVRLLLAHGADPSIGDEDNIPTFRRIKYSINSGRVPDDPASQERLQEIRQLLGDPSA